MLPVLMTLGSDDADTETIVSERRSTTAARLAAIFVDVDDVDAFTGMVSESHVVGTEFGELQLAMWITQFQALRDGDRFFYGNDVLLDEIADTFGISLPLSCTKWLEGRLLTSCQMC